MTIGENWTKILKGTIQGPIYPHLQHIRCMLNMTWTTTYRIYRLSIRVHILYDKFHSQCHTDLHSDSFHTCEYKMDHMSNCYMLKLKDTEYQQSKTIRHFWRLTTRHSDVWKSYSFWRALNQTDWNISDLPKFIAAEEWC